jgi:hypothetical protein
MKMITSGVIDDFLKKDRIIRVIFLLTIITGLIVNFWRNLSFSASWTIGEWLINYEGGFVRRGFPGHIIFNASKLINLSPVLLADLISIFIYLLLFVVVICVAGNRISKTILLSPVILLAPILGDYVVRKDCMNLLLLSITLLISSRLRIKSPGFIGPFLILLINTFAILSHESFFFYGISSAAIVLWLSDNNKDFSYLEKIRSISIILSPSVFIFLVCTIFHGDPNQAFAINHSYFSLSSQFPDNYPKEPQGSIWSLTMTGLEGLKYSLWPILFDLTDGIIWRPIPLLITIYYVAGVISYSGVSIDKKNNFNPTLIKQVLIIQITSMFPLFILGHDYGRWLFMLSTSTVLTLGFLGNNVRCSANETWLENSIGKTIKQLPYSVLIFLLFTFGIPASWNSWSLLSFFDSSLIGYIAKFLVTEIRIIH